MLRQWCPQAVPGRGHTCNSVGSTELCCLALGACLVPPASPLHLCTATVPSTGLWNEAPGRSSLLARFSQSGADVLWDCHCPAVTVVSVILREEMTSYLVSFILLIQYCRPSLTIPQTPESHFFCPHKTLAIYFPICASHHEAHNDHILTSAVRLLLSTCFLGHLLRVSVCQAPGQPQWGGREKPGGVRAQGGSLCSHSQVSAKEDGNVIKDTNVVLEIPAPTTIAYGIIELYVKLDGQFGECHLLPRVLGEGDGKCRDVP